MEVALTAKLLLILFAPLILLTMHSLLTMLPVLTLLTMLRLLRLLSLLREPVKNILADFKGQSLCSKNLSGKGGYPPPLTGKIR